MVAFNDTLPMKAKSESITFKDSKNWQSSNDDEAFHDAESSLPST